MISDSDRLLAISLAVPGAWHDMWQWHSPCDISGSAQVPGIISVSARCLDVFNEFPYENVAALLPDVSLHSLGLDLLLCSLMRMLLLN